MLLTEIGKLLFGNGELLPTVLIGAGRLGTAVSSFISRDTNGYKLIAAFDINPALEGKEISGVTIRPLSELESFCAAHKPVVAVLCAAQKLWTFRTSWFGWVFRASGTSATMIFRSFIRRSQWKTSIWATA